MPKKSLLLAVSSVFLLSGCILVKNFGAYWEKGTIDKALAGCWTIVPKEGQQQSGMQQDKKLCAETPSDLDYAKLTQHENGNASEYQMKSLKIGKHDFLMMVPKQQGFSGNSMYKYAKKDGGFVLYQVKVPGPKAESEFWKNLYIPEEEFYMDTNNTLTINILNEKTVASLQKLADMAEWWEVHETYKKEEKPAS